MKKGILLGLLVLSIALMALSGCKKAIELPPAPDEPTGPVGQATSIIDIVPRGDVAPVGFLPGNIFSFTLSKAILKLPASGNRPLGVTVTDDIIYNKVLYLNKNNMWAVVTLSAGSGERLLSGPKGAQYIAKDDTISDKITKTMALQLNRALVAAGTQNMILVFSCTLMDRVNYQFNCHSVSGASNWLGRGFEVVYDSDGPIVTATPATITITTTSTALTVTTNERATCQYSVGQDGSYGQMTGIFSASDDGLTHTADLTNLNTGTTIVYAKCMDEAGNTNVNSAQITITVNPPSTAASGDTGTDAGTDTGTPPDTGTGTGTDAGTGTGTDAGTGTGTDAGTGTGTDTGTTPSVTPPLPPAPTAPQVLSSLPTGGVATTSPVTLQATTDKAALCRYSTSSAASYTAMGSSAAMTSTDWLTHTKTLGSLTESSAITCIGSPCTSATYIYYIRCADKNDQSLVMTSPHQISFVVRVPPVISNPKLNGIAVTTGTTVKSFPITLMVSTNEKATCRYSTTPGTPYGSMTGTFSTSSTGIPHSVAIQSLTNGNKNYYVRCMDAKGNLNPDDFTISFRVEVLPEAPTE